MSPCRAVEAKTNSLFIKPDILRQCVCVCVCEETDVCTHWDMSSSCGACEYSNSYMFSVTSTAAHSQRAAAGAAAAGRAHMSGRRHKGATTLMGP